MKSYYFGFILLFLAPGISFAQVDSKNEYQFELEKSVYCTPVKSQDRTGTCWSYATSSFFESESIRLGKGEHDISEMFVVRNIYMDKARNYLLRQGKANFSQGSLAHDPLVIARSHGLVPQAVYTGLPGGEQKHDHGEMEAVMKGMLDGLLKRKPLSSKWKIAMEGILDAYLGEVPEKFDYKGKSYTPKSFAEEMGIAPSDYINITSYTHHPFYEPFVLEIPDNYSNGLFYNLPMEDVVRIATHAVKKGYSVAWDGDVSEKGFSAKEGIAVLPTNKEREDLFTSPGEEVVVTQQMRQETFESYRTTDDHLMHLTGMAKDKKGNKYFLIKNSWGEISPHKGYLYMSIPYYQLKTVSILVHKDAIPAEIATKLRLKS